MFHSHAGGGVDNNAIAPTGEGWTEGLIMLCKVSAGTDIKYMQRHAGLKGKPLHFMVLKFFIYCTKDSCFRSLTPLLL